MNKPKFLSSSICCHGKPLRRQNHWFRNHKNKAESNLSLLLGPMGGTKLKIGQRCFPGSRIKRNYIHNIEDDAEKDKVEALYTVEKTSGAD